MKFKPGTKVHIGLDGKEGVVVGHDDETDEVIVKAGLLGRQQKLPRYQVMDSNERYQRHCEREESRKRHRMEKVHGASVRSMEDLTDELDQALSSVRRAENDGRSSAIQHLCTITEALIGKVSSQDGFIELLQQKVDDQEDEIEQLRKHARMETRL